MKHLCWFLAAVVLLGSSAAHAGEAELEAAAREYYRAAGAQFEAKHYLEAQAGFAAGYELSHKPGFLWNMAECARLLGNQSRARELYTQYLKDAPAAAPQRADAELRLKELDTPAAASPPSPPLLPAAANAASRPSAPLPPPSRPLAPRLTAAPAGALSAPGLGTSHEPSTPLTKRWWFWTGAGAVVAATVVTVVAVSVSGSAPQGPAAPSGTFTVDWRSK